MKIPRKIRNFDGKVKRLEEGHQIEVPAIPSFRHFLENHAKIKINGGPDAGTYTQYTFVGREALIEVCDTLDMILGNTLTPALSHPMGEGGSGMSCESSNDARFVDALATIPPLPKGEGRGEGEVQAGERAPVEHAAAGAAHTAPLTDATLVLAGGAHGVARPTSEEEISLAPAGGEGWGEGEEDNAAVVGTRCCASLESGPRSTAALPVTAEPLTDATLVLAGGAQFGKTVLELNLAAYLAAVRFLSPGVYLPDDKLAADIVDAKFRPDVVDQIPWFANLCKLGKVENKSGKAVANKGAFLVTDGKRKAVGLFRGLQKVPTSFSLDVVVRDEEDDIPREKAKFLSGRLTASQLRFQIIVGTQRIHGAGQNKQWEDGSQGTVLIGPKAEGEKRKAETPNPEPRTSNTENVAQVSKPAVPPMSQSASLETCGQPRKLSGCTDSEVGATLVGRLSRQSLASAKAYSRAAEQEVVGTRCCASLKSGPRSTAALPDLSEPPPGFINPEDHWPQVCRVQLGAQPSPNDPRLTHEGDFRRPDRPHDPVAAARPGAVYYLAHPETGEPLDRHNPRWHHRRPERMAQRRWSYRLSQLGCAAIDLAQIVGHWARAVADDEEMTSFSCDRLARPRSAAQSLTPQILERSRSVEPFDFGAVDRHQVRVAGLDTGNRCWLFTRELHSAAEKRCVRVDQIALGDLVPRVQQLWAALDLSALFIDEAPAVDQARTLALLFNGLAALEHWPRVDWNARDSYFTLPGGLTWDGRTRQWRNLRCAVVRFSKKSLGMGIEHGAVEFQEAGQTKFVPLIECNRFEAIDRVLKEFLTPAENVIEVCEIPSSILHPPSSRRVRQDPSMRLPRRVAGSPGILETLDAHLLTGSQRVKDDATGELGSFVDKCDNHLLLADAYSALAEIATTNQGPVPGVLVSIEGIRLEERGFPLPKFRPIKL